MDMETASRVLPQMKLPTTRFCTLSNNSSSIMFPRSRVASCSFKLSTGGREIYRTSNEASVSQSSESTDQKSKFLAQTAKKIGVLLLNLGGQRHLMMFSHSCTTYLLILIS